MTSAQALEIGLIERTVPRDELLDVAIAEAGRLGGDRKRRSAQSSAPCMREARVHSSKDFA
jgi:enoyl-CoA hydratase/carnithine racemase